MLHLPSQNALAVHERDLLHLERALQSGCVLKATTEKQQALLVGQFLGQLHNGWLQSQCALDGAGQQQQTTDDILAAVCLGHLILTQSQRPHRDCDNLTGVRFCAGNPYLAAGVDVHSALRGARDGAAHRVGDAHAECPVVLGVLESLQRVRRLARLADEHRRVVAEHRALPVQHVARELKHHGHLHQLLHRLTCRQSCIEGGSTGNEQDAPRLANDVVDGGLQTPQFDGPCAVLKSTLIRIPHQR
mmetsp:Transcript_21230/g.40413  ORF Transcript_21230/g.40413 Transcript_21230/m.40413 type:complete len:246 (-) Transcript_21230:948-1685(-)